MVEFWDLGLNFYQKVIGSLFTPLYVTISVPQRKNTLLHQVLKIPLGHRHWTKCRRWLRALRPSTTSRLINGVRLLHLLLALGSHRCQAARSARETWARRLRNGRGGGRGSFFLQGKDLANANRTSEDYRRGRPPVYNLTALGTEGAVSTFGNGSTRQASLCLLNTCQTIVPQQKQSPREVYGVTPSGAGIPHQPRPASSRVATPRGISFVTRHFMTRRIRSGAGTSRHPGSTLRVGQHPQ